MSLFKSPIKTDNLHLVKKGSLALCAVLLISSCSHTEQNTQIEKQQAIPASIANTLSAENLWQTPENEQAATYLLTCKQDTLAAATLFDTLAHPSLNISDNAFLDEINQLDIILDRVASNASLFSNVHPNAEVRSAAKKCQQNIVKLYNDISLSKSFYDRLAMIKTAKLNPLDQRFVQDMIKGFKRSGVNLSEQKRTRVKELNEEIVKLGQSFYANINSDVLTLELDSVKELEGLPQDFIDAHPANEHGKIILTTNYPDYFPVMQYAKNDALRLNFYTLFKKRAYPKNETILKDLIRKRYELAKLLGYKNYAEYALEELMIKTPKKAQTFIDKINTLAKPKSDQEYATLLKRLQKIDPAAKQVSDWQKTYLEELVKSEQYDVDSQEIRQYFSYDNVKQGIFNLTEEMFGVKIKPWDTEVWHESVKAYELWDDNKLIGKFFLDMHPRDGKYKHAAAFGYQDGVTGVQPPITALVCNFPGEKDGSELMEHTQVETFLHEFGHLLHALFAGDHQRLHFSGIKTEHDFVEAPSQMLEEWVWDKETLKTFAKNSQGETIPDHLIEKMNAGRKFGKGLWTRHQMYYAAISLNLYNNKPDDLDFVNLMSQYQATYSPFNYVENTYFHASFGHLYGYSAAYYTYMWSLVIASDMFSEFEKNGLRDPKTAERYRQEVLAPGGSKDANELVERFLKRPYSFKTFADSLSTH